MNMTNIQMTDNMPTACPTIKTLTMRDDLALYLAYAEARGWDLKGAPSENSIPVKVKGISKG